MVDARTTTGRRQGDDTHSASAIDNAMDWREFWGTTTKPPAKKNPDRSRGQS